MTGVDQDALGRAAYNAYCASVGGRSAISGDRLPTWDEQREDIRVAWRRAADAVRACVDLERGPR